MLKKYFINCAVLIFLAISLIIIANKIFAEEIVGTGSISYPVKELGNCTDKENCKSFCDKPENIQNCFAFAKNNNLMSQEEIDTAEKFLEAGGNGPGGCKTKDACESFCEDTSHINECVSFAEKNNLLPPDKLEEAKKFQAAIAKGVKPPACKNKKECDVYCDNPNNMEECIVFGEAAGFIQGKDLEDAKKMLAALKRGVTPPPCRGKEQCDAYCSSPDNMEVCINFAMEAGFMNDQEKADSQKMLEALKKGIKPPNCRGKEECDSYCSQDAHFEECLNFAEAAGFMSAEDAVMARKTGGKGPGGCKGKDECEAFCNNPDNQETCFNFAKEHGLIPEEDLKQMEEGKQKFKEALEQTPPAVLECLNAQFGADMMEKFKSGATMPPKEIGDQMKTCFEKMGPPPRTGAPGEGGQMPPGDQTGPGQTGPGGCKSPEECENFCKENPQECQGFGPPLNGSGPEVNPQAQPDEQQDRINPLPCEGENCQYGPPPEGQYNPNPEQQQEQPDQQSPVPQEPPAEQQPIQPAPIEPPPPSSLLAPETFLGSVINIFSQVFLIKK